MEITKSFKNAFSVSKGYLSNATEILKNNEYINSLKTNVKQKYSDVVSNIENAIDELKREINSPVDANSIEKAIENTPINEAEIIDDKAVLQAIAEETVVVRNVVEKAVVEKRVVITDRQRKIVRLITRIQTQRKENYPGVNFDCTYNEQNITAAFLGKKFGVHPRTIQRDLSFLQGLNIITHIGPDKGGYWELAQQN